MSLSVIPPRPPKPGDPPLSDPADFLQPFSEFTPLFRQMTFLGTVSAVPSPGRCNVSAAMLTLTSGSSIILDCGEATQHQLMRSRISKISTIDAILITHLHGDHFFGIFGLLATLSSTKRVAPMIIVGPVGISEALTSVLTVSDTGLGYPIHVYTVPDTEETVLDAAFEHMGIRVLSSPIAHRVPTVGYIITELPRPGKLDSARARALGVPAGPYYGELKAGRDITLPDGRLVRAADVVSPEIPGRKVAFLQDTHDSSAALPSAHGASLMVHECTYDASTEHALAVERGHSTTAMAAAAAVAADAGTLILTHFSSRYSRERLVKAELKNKVAVVFEEIEPASECVFEGIEKAAKEAQREIVASQQRAAAAAAAAAAGNTTDAHAATVENGAAMVDNDCCCPSTTCADADAKGGESSPSAAATAPSRHSRTLNVADLRCEAAAAVAVLGGRTEVHVAADFRTFELVGERWVPQTDANLDPSLLL